jgi:prepilin-type N-terminal cleavage/methylation domain-containing protein
MATHANARRRGFTLIEIMVVVAIISGLAGIILFYLTGEAKKASAEMAVLKMAEEMSQLSRAVDDYYTSARIAAIRPTTRCKPSPSAR